MTAPFSRLRTDDQLKTVDTNQHRTTYDNGVLVVDQDEQGPGNIVSGMHRSMADWVTPGYTRKIARGSIINMPMSSVEERRNITAGTLEYHKPSGSGIYVTRYSPSFHFTSELGVVNHLSTNVNSTDLIFEAGTEAAANVRSPELQGLVSIAELRETMRFLRNPVKSWTDHLKRIRRTKRKSPSKRDRTNSLGQFVSDNWLSYRYGIKPIMQDISNAAEAVRVATAPVKPTRYTARGFAQGQDDASLTVQSTYYKRDTTTTKNTRVRAGILYETEFNANPFGLEISQLPVAVWEAIPYSFVIDWFANVGSFIEAITPKFGITELASWTSVTTVETSRSESIATEIGGPWTVSADGLALESLATKYKTRLPGYRVGLVLKHNPLTGYEKFERSTDLFALSEQLLRSR